MLSIQSVPYPPKPLRFVASKPTLVEIIKPSLIDSMPDSAIMSTMV
jgi:hypothetical protein